MYGPTQQLIRLWVGEPARQMMRFAFLRLRHSFVHIGSLEWRVLPED